MRFLLLQADSQYGALGNYIKNWNNILCKKGFQSRIVDFSEIVTYQDLKLLLSKEHPDFVISCNGICGEHIEEYLPKDCYYLTVLYDNPIWHHERLKNLGTHSFVYSCDEFYAQFIQKHYPSIRKVGFFPLSGEASPSPVPYEERNIDLLFTGSYFDVNASYQNIQSLRTGIRTLALQTVEYMLETPELLVWESMDMAFSQWNITPSDEERKELLILFTCVDSFVRAYTRNKVLTDIVKSSIPITIYGNGWDKFPLISRQNITFCKGYGNVSLEALGHARISLNIMPWFRAGIQERNISAMLSGAISLTDTSQYIDTHFHDGIDILLYKLNDTKAIPKIIEDILANPEKAKAIATAGQLLASSFHTWECRVNDLLKQL